MLLTVLNRPEAMKQMSLLRVATTGRSAIQNDRTNRLSRKI
jgi:hypothetical protein